MIYVALLTVNELVRRRFILAALCATALLVGLTGWGFTHLMHMHDRHGRPLTAIEIRSMTAVLVILIAYMFSFVLAVVAVFVAAPSLANDIENGVLLPIVTRPLSRSAILSGKALALAFVVCAYAAVAGAAEFAVARAATGYLPPHPLAAIGYLCLLATVMLVLAFALSTRLSALAGSIVAIVFFGGAWMAGIVGSLGTYYQNTGAIDAGILSQLLLPTDAMWREAVYNLEPAVSIAAFSAHHVWPGPFFVLAPPPVTVIAWTIAWIAAVYAVATRSFALRDI